MNKQLFMQAERKLFDYYKINPTSQYVDIPRINASVRVLECGQGEPLIFVAGDTSSGSTFAPLVALLPDFRCIMIDRPGTGLSSTPDYTQMPLKEFAAETLAGVVKQLGISKTNIVGSSFGGYFTLAFAHRYPELVNKIILEGMPGYVPGYKIGIFEKLMSLRWFNNMLIKNMKVNRKSIIDNFKRMGHKKSIEQNRIPEAVWEFSLQMGMHTDGLKNDFGYFPLVASFSGVKPGVEFTWDELQIITAPLCVLWGADDTFCEPDMLDNIKKKMKPQFVKVFADSGHLPYMENTQEHAEIIRQFIKAQ